MATLILGGIGSLIGGPIGGALGALGGRQIDAAIIGGPTRDGARLKDLSITTSSYGTPMARHFGRMRTAGSIIWSTEMAENRETSGGKGKPKVTTFSYSTSLAVAIASRPIIDIGRIWADGNLLRGAAGDLKVGGAMRLYHGHGDQPVDPLIAAAEGPSCPAFRNRAYVVFEDLQLEDFGNRIPALSFEVFADPDDFALADLAQPHIENLSSNRSLSGLSGISYEGGRLGDVFATLAELYPSAADAAGNGLEVLAIDPAEPPYRLEGTPVVPSGSDGFGTRQGRAGSRKDDARGIPPAMRYYDTARDYQPGVQRVSGRATNADSGTFEFPAALDAQAARTLIQSANGRAKAQRETLRWRIAELDPDIGPGRLVRLPDVTGTWLVESWEWREGGVELGLVRQAVPVVSDPASEPGFLPNPADGISLPTWLRAFELPWDGLGFANGRQLFAAAATGNAQWAGAALYAERGGRLEPVGTTGRGQAVMGELASAAGPSPALLFEPDARLEIELAASHMAFTAADLVTLAAGKNRLLIGDEVMQFAQAERLTETRWEVCGLLRGRAGTEPAANTGQPVGSSVTLLDAGLLSLGDAMGLDGPESPVAAIGRGDAEPVIAPVENPGLGAQPLVPVHARRQTLANGEVSLTWIRRSRGVWTWDSAIETPINESFERYVVGIGPPDAPVASWELSEPLVNLGAATVAANSGQIVWVRQIGNTQASHPLFLTIL
uniref:phage tail protein n=1 Tax=Parerythrobacter lutipelagi TaxID=1964208 RepID=UPI0010F85366|nr:phage tail protein [Parerythrobacter lutipelagi]